MPHCPVCQTEYTQGEVSCCLVCDWDLTPCPEDFVERQNVHIAWAREIWIKFQVLQQQLPTSINAEIEANPQLSQLREESQGYLENATSEEAIAELISVEIETTPIKISPPKPVKKPKVGHRTSGGAAALRGYFVLPELIEQGMQQRLGRGVINNVMFLNNELLVVCATGSTTLFNLSSGEVLWEIDCPAGWGVISGNGTLLALGCKENIYLWDLCSGRLLRQLQGDKINWTNYVGCKNIAISTDGKLLAVGDSDGTVRLWDVVSGREVQQLWGHTKYLNNLGFSPDGMLLASRSIQDNTVRLWDVASGTQLPQLLEYEKLLGEVIFSPDSKLLASVCRDSSTRLWDIISGTELRQLQEKTSELSIDSVAFYPDGNLLVLGTTHSNKTVWLWDVTSDTRRQLQGSTDEMYNVAFSSDNRLMASWASEDNTVWLWDVASGTQVKQLQTQPKAICDVALSPDNKIVASGSFDNTVRLWDVASSREVYQLHGHTDYVKSVAFSPDGKLLASASWDSTIRLWNLATSKEVKQLQNDEYSVSCVSFTPNGKLLASGGINHTLRLWDVVSGRQVQQLHLQLGEWIESIAFNRDGTIVALGTHDNKTVRFWKVNI